MRPLGHFTSTLHGPAAWPRPKVTGSSLCEK